MMLHLAISSITKIVIGEWTDKHIHKMKAYAMQIYAILLNVINSNIIYMNSYAVWVLAINTKYLGWC